MAFIQSFQHASFVWIQCMLKVQFFVEFEIDDFFIVSFDFLSFGKVDKLQSSPQCTILYQ
jgi:hypothetical protein